MVLELVILGAGVKEPHETRNHDRSLNLNPNLRSKMSHKNIKGKNNDSDMYDLLFNTFISISNIYSYL